MRGRNTREMRTDRWRCQDCRKMMIWQAKTVVLWNFASCQITLLASSDSENHKNHADITKPPLNERKLLKCCWESHQDKKLHNAAQLNRVKLNEKSESSLLTTLSNELQQTTFNHTTQTSSLPCFLSSHFRIQNTNTILQFNFNYSHYDSYLMLCICNISGSVALSEATKLPTGMFSILLTVRGSGKKTGPSLTSRTVTWTVAVELGP